MRSKIVLGIDAAWGGREPSGVALVRGNNANWTCLAVAPSYEAFIGHASGVQLDWSLKPRGGRPNVPKIIEAAAALAGEQPDLVCVDMPLSLLPIQSRRAADDAVSRLYGRFWCSAHSPSSVRPGSISDEMRSEFEALGYTLATCASEVGGTPRLVEVYPHPAIVELLKLDRRLEYKVSKASKYWPDDSRAGRQVHLLNRFCRLEAELKTRLGHLPFRIPLNEEVATLATLKRYEDALDALVCCWVGVEYLSSRARPLGDDTAAIWCPIQGAPVIRHVNLQGGSKSL